MLERRRVSTGLLSVSDLIPFVSTFYLILFQLHGLKYVLQAKKQLFCYECLASKQTLQKKWSFSLRISSVNVIVSVLADLATHLLKKSLMEKFIFCGVKIISMHIV